MDFNLTRLPLLSGLILRAPSSAFDGFPVYWPESLVSVEFPALVVVYMLLLAMGALVAGLTGCFGWGDGSGCDSCWHG